MCYLLFEVNTSASISKIGHVCKEQDYLVYFAMVCFAVITYMLLALVHFSYMRGSQNQRIMNLYCQLDWMKNLEVSQRNACF